MNADNNEKFYWHNLTYIMSAYSASQFPFRQRRLKQVWMGAITTPDLGDGCPPAGSRGGAPVRGLGTKYPEAEEFFKKLQANFTYFW